MLHLTRKEKPVIVRPEAIVGLIEDDGMTKIILRGGGQMFVDQKIDHVEALRKSAEEE